MIRIALQITTLVFFIGLLACGGSSDSSGSNNNGGSTPDPQRSFYMGFTPWPYAATVTAITDTYVRIQDNGDMVKHHLMEGIPWQEAFDSSALPANVDNDITSRLNQTQSGKTIYLSIDSLNTERNDLAPNWGDSGNQPLPVPWNTRNFNDAEVITAYSNFALDMIDRFNPAYFNYGPEVSDLILNDEAKFTQFLTFAESVYDNIKAVHPNLPLMVSVALKSPGSTEAATLINNFSRIANFVDVVGISVYPYAFFNHTDKGNPDTMPTNWLSQISALSGTKPIAITETGWAAEDISIASFGLSIQSDADKQKEFVEQVLQQADNLSMEFVIWFAVVDYDDLWGNVLGQDDVSRIWRDIGLYDESLNARSALQAWREYYLREKI